MTITYDPAGRRFTSTDVNGVTTYFDYDGNQLIGEQFGSGSGSVYADIAAGIAASLNGTVQYTTSGPDGFNDALYLPNGMRQALDQAQRNALGHRQDVPPGAPEAADLAGGIGNDLRKSPTGGYYNPYGEQDDGIGGLLDTHRNMLGMFDRLHGILKSGLNAAAGLNPICNAFTAFTGKNPDGTKTNKLEKGLAWLNLVAPVAGAFARDAEIMGPGLKAAGRMGHEPTCFPAGTKVAVKRSDHSDVNALTQQGAAEAAEAVDEKQIIFVPIEQVKKDDTVVSRDETTGKTLYKRVSQTFSHTSDHLITLTLADSKTGKAVETIQTTRNHPLYVDGKGWIPAGGLAIGNSIVTRAGPTLVIKDIYWERQADGYKVYNFEVEDTHTYFVGTANGGSWVHNYGIYPEKPLNHAYQRGHAADFGVSGNWNRQNAQKFKDALDNHMDNAPLTGIGTFRAGSKGSTWVTHYYDPATGLWAAYDSGGNFVAAWKLSPAQIQYLISHGNIR